MSKPVWTEDRDDPNQMCNEFFVSALQQSFYKFCFCWFFNYFYEAFGLDLYHSTKNISVPI